MEQDLEDQNRLRQNRLGRVVVWLVLFQFLVGPIALLRRALPPTIGIGQFSVAIDFRYLAAGCLGLCLALLVLVPVAFAFSARSAVQRFVYFVPSLALACIVGMAVLIVLVHPGAGMIPVSYLVDEIMSLACIAFTFSVGVAIVPLFFRAWRGTYLAGPQFQSSGVQWDAKVDWLILAIALVVVFVWSPLFDRNTGLAALTAAAGMALGAIAFASLSWTLRESSNKFFSSAVVVHALVFVFVPGLVAWLADYVYFPLLPAGSGAWFVSFLFGALVLLIHVLLLRALGCRMVRQVVRPTTKRPMKATVDPFSD